MAHWNGSSWAHLDINFAATAAGNAIYFARNGDMYIGTNDVGIGTGTYAGITTLSYSGSAENYPLISIKRTGGTTARLLSIRNESTDAELTFDYALSNGETITIELNPFTGTRLVSSFIGEVPGAILPGNDSGAFYLDPGNTDSAKSNIITCYITTSGSPTLTSLLYYRSAYLSQD
jgi:phage-related protein